MALIAIAEVGSSTFTDMPTPAFNGGYQVDIMDVDASTTGRNQSGTMIRDRVAVKRKINCTWNYLTPRQMQVLLSAVQSPFFQVKYLDPLTNSYQTRTFYVGDRSAPMYSMEAKTGTLYTSLSMNFIEQ